MIGRLLCFFYGHKRGKLMVNVFDARIGKQVKSYSCPRCGHHTIYKVKVPT